LSVAPTMPAPTMVSASGVPASTPLPLVSTTVALPPTPVPSSGNSGRGEVAQW
jgi:hypothetical protein